MANINKIKQLIFTSFCLLNTYRSLCTQDHDQKYVVEYLCDHVRRTGNEHYLEQMYQEFSLDEMAARGIILSKDEIDALAPFYLNNLSNKMAQFEKLLCIYQQKPRAFELTLWTQPYGYVPACILASLIRSTCNSAVFLGHQDPVYLMTIFVNMIQQRQWRK